MKILLRALILAAGIAACAPAMLLAQVIGSQPINAVSTGSGCTAVSQSCASFGISGNASVTLQVSGTFVGTLTFESTSDGINWKTTSLTDLSSGGLATTTASTGQFALGNTGVLGLRARATAWSSGLAIVNATGGSTRVSTSSGGGGGTGTVTNIAATFTGGLVSIAGSPITTTGSLDFTVAGTSGGVPCFNSSSTWASSAVIGAGVPVVGGGAGGCVAAGTRQGNTTKYVSFAGSAPSTGDCAQFDANGNISGAGAACGGGSGTVTSAGTSFTGGLISVAGSPVTTSGTAALTVAGTSGGVPYFSSSSTWASSSALTSNAFMLGGGAGSAPKVAAGLFTDGTSIITVGQSGTSVGKVSFANATSGTVTHQAATGALGSAVVTWAGVTGNGATTTGSITTNNCAKFNSSGQLVDAGTTCGGSGSTYQTLAAYAVKTANYTVNMATDGIIEGTTNAFDVTLPTAVGVAGQAVVVINQQTANAITMKTTSGQTINGAASGSVTLTNTACTFGSSNSQWIITSCSGLPLTGAGNVNQVLHGSVSPSFSAVALADMATQANNTILSNVSGGSAVPSANTTIPMTAISLFNAGVCQDTTASIGASLPAAASAPTAHCLTGTSVNLGVAQFTAASSAQTMQNHIRILEAPVSTTFNIQGSFIGETTSVGSTVWTFSYLRVPAGTTWDGSFSTQDITVSARNANLFNPFTQSVTITGLAVGDILFWKFTLKTMPTTSGNQDLIDLALMPVIAKPIGG